MRAWVRLTPQGLRLTWRSGPMQGSRPLGLLERVLWYLCARVPRP